MLRTAFALVCGIAAGAAFEAQRGPVASATVRPHAVLNAIGGLSPADLSALDAGAAVARVFETDRRQVAVVGAVRVRAPREAIVARYRDISHLAASDMVLQVGAFSDPPRSPDVSALLFEPYDLDAIRDCRPGDCRVRISTRMAAMFQHDVNWRAPDWRDQVARLWQQALAEYAAQYRMHGADALPEYHNKEERLRVRDEFDVLFRASEPIAVIAPEFIEYLREYPRRPLPGTDDILYWSKDDFGIRPVVSLSHLTTYVPSGSRNGFIATRQIYATHYLDAGLGLTLILDDGEGGSCLVSVNRVRTRSLTSFFRGFVRSTVQNRSREGLEKTLRSVKTALER